MDLQNGRGFEYGVWHLRPHSSSKLYEVVSQLPDLSPERAKELITLGSVYVDHLRRLDTDFPVPAQALLRVHSKPRRFLKNWNWSERILWENSNLLVLNKPSGIPCHPTVDNAVENILAQLQQQISTDIFLTHRLDVPTSGLLVFAKNKKSQTNFNRGLVEGKIRKIYSAIIPAPGLPPGKILHYMEKSPRAPKKVTPHETPNSLHCELHILQNSPLSSGHVELEIELITGRTHQIRAQLSASGFPILGDTLYGGSLIQGWNSEHIALKAKSLQWQAFDEFEDLQIDITECTKTPVLTP